MALTPCRLRRWTGVSSLRIGILRTFPSPAHARNGPAARAMQTMTLEYEYCNELSCQAWVFDPKMGRNIAAHLVRCPIVACVALPPEGILEARPRNALKSHPINCLVIRNQYRCSTK